MSDPRLDDLGRRIDAAMRKHRITPLRRYRAAVLTFKFNTNGAAETFRQFADACKQFERRTAR